MEQDLFQRDKATTTTRHIGSTPTVISPNLTMTQEADHPILILPLQPSPFSLDCKHCQQDHPGCYKTTHHSSNTALQYGHHSNFDALPHCTPLRICHFRHRCKPYHTLDKCIILGEHRPSRYSNSSFIPSRCQSRLSSRLGAWRLRP